MSAFFSQRLKKFKAYVPGEQPKDAEYIKLNTNENPYYPNRFQTLSDTDVKNLRLYSDPECSVLVNAVAAAENVGADCVLPTNGSDEALAFCFLAFGDNGAAFPDVTYGFYKVLAELFGIRYREYPLKNDFTVDTAAFIGGKEAIFLANPNAQTGIMLPLIEIEKICKADPDRAVVIDEAYVDFGGESAVALIQKYNNLTVIKTFSKSRSLAGARVGYAVSCPEVIAELKKVKNCFNPYNVNSLSMKLAAAAFADTEYFKECTRKIIATRERLTAELKARGFEVLPSKANFVLAQTAKKTGLCIYRSLKERGVLVRHFKEPRIENFVRITVGTDAQIDALLEKIDLILRDRSE